MFGFDVGPPRGAVHSVNIDLINGDVKETLIVGFVVNGIVVITLSQLFNITNSCMIQAEYS